MNNISENPYPLQNNWNNNLGSFKTLPPEIFVEITSFLKKEEVCRLEQTSKEFRRMTQFFWIQKKNNERINFNWHCCDGLPNRDKIEYVLNKTLLRIHNRNYKLNSYLESRFPLIAVYFFSLEKQYIVKKIKNNNNKESLEAEYAKKKELIKNERTLLNRYLKSEPQDSAPGEKLIHVLFKARTIINNSTKIINFNNKILPIIKDLHDKNRITSTTFFILNALQGFNFNQVEPLPGSKRKRTVDDYNIFKETLNELELLALDASFKRDFRTLEYFLKKYSLKAVPEFVPQQFHGVLPPILNNYIASKYDFFRNKDDFLVTNYDDCQSSTYSYYRFDRFDIDLASIDEAILDHAINEYGDQIPINLLRIAVRIKYYLKRYDEANILIEKLLFRNSTEEDLIFSFHIKYNLNKNEECDILFNTFLKNNRNIDLLKKYMRVKMKLEKHTEAEEILNLILSLLKCTDLDFYAGVIKFCLWKYVEANTFFDSYLELNPPGILSSHRLFLISNNKKILGDYKGALNLIQYIKKPKVKIRIFGAILKIYLKKYEEADKDLALFIDNIKNYNEVTKLKIYIAIAYTKLRLNEIELSEKYFDLGISILDKTSKDSGKIDDFLVYSNAAHVKKLLNKLTEADELYDKARCFEKQLPGSFSEAMQIKFSLGKTEEAKKITIENILSYLPNEVKNLSIQLDVFSKS